MNSPAHMNDPRDAEIEDRPPVNYEAEQALLGAILANDRAYDRVSDRLKAEHFADGAHGRIYAACAKLIESGKTANAVTLKNLFEHDEALAEVGGAVYLAKLQGSYVTIINAKDYSDTIIETWLRRSIIDIGEHYAGRARLGDTENGADAILEEMGVEIAEAGEVGVGEAPGRALPDVLDAWLENVEAARKAGGILGVSTGLTALDDKLGGLHRSNLVVLAGRPGQGKTALGLTIGQNAARADKSVLVLSIEMTDEQLGGRLFARETGVSVDRQLRGKVSDADLLALGNARRAMHDLNLAIESPRHPTVQACRAKARRIKRRKGLDLIVIDYLQLMTGAHRMDNRVQEISIITRELKKMAVDLDVPVLLLSQLNRQVEARDDKRPNLADLRDSGSIEQDADVVMFVYREHEYESRSEPRRKTGESVEKFTAREADWRGNLAKTKDVAEVLIRKNRHGPTSDVCLHFDAGRTTFGNLGDVSSTSPVDQELEF